MRYSIASLSILFLTSLAFAQTQPSTQPLSKAELRQLEQRVAVDFAQHDYQKGADDCRQMCAALPKAAMPHYNLACALARLDHKDEALAELSRGIDLGYAETYHLQHDPDLAGLHEDARFKDAAARCWKAEQNGKFEMGDEIKGLKTVEDFPEGGLRFRVRMSPDATAEKPERLIIWLHPSGESGDRVVERLAPMLNQHGFALAVFTQKQYLFWTPEEMNQLTENTLSALAKIPGIDGKKPILMGFSAGGQMALQLYNARPDVFGGMILNSAYPIDPEAFMVRHQAIPMPPPKSDATKDVPILEFVGTADGGAAVWKKVEGQWRDAGVPLSVIYVPDQPHTFLLRGKQLPVLEEWLTQLANGKKPSGLTAATQP